MNNLVSTKELAAIIGVRASTITDNAKKIGMHIKNGVPTYYTQEQATLIKNLISKSGRNDLSNVREVENVSTEYELIENYKKASESLMQLLNQKKIELEIENQSLKAKQIEDAPKVEYFNQLVDSKDCVDVGTVAKVLNYKNIGRTKLFEILRNQNVLMCDNRPYQKYIDAGYFRVVESKWTSPDGEIHINFKTVVYQSGIDFIRKTINKQFKENLSNPVYMQKAIEDAAGKIAGEIA